MPKEGFAANPLPDACDLRKKAQAAARALCLELEPDGTRYDYQQNKQHEDYARRSKTAKPFYAAHTSILLPFDLVYLMIVAGLLIGWVGKCALAEMPKNRVGRAAKRAFFDGQAKRPPSLGCSPIGGFSRRLKLCAPWGKPQLRFIQIAV